MNHLLVIVNVLVFIVTLFTPVYLLGRVIFASSPFVINLITSDNSLWNEGWNKTRFMSATTFFSISLLLSIVFGNFIACSKLGYFDFSQIFFYLAIHIIMVILFEYKMDNMFRPLTAIRNWRRKTFDEQFKFVNNFPKFTEEQPMTMDYVQEIRCTIETLVAKSKKIDCNRSETEKLFNSRLNKIENLLAEADTVYLDSGLNFKVKNVKNISIDGVMEMYSIQLNSKRDLKNLMLHKNFTGKIIFGKKLGEKGLKVHILNFFMKYTDIIENAERGEEKQIKSCMIINEIACITFDSGAKELISESYMSKFLKGIREKNLSR